MAVNASANAGTTAAMVVENDFAVTNATLSARAGNAPAVTVGGKLIVTNSTVTLNAPKATVDGEFDMKSDEVVLISRTGDNTDLVLLASLLSISVLGLGAVLVLQMRLSFPKLSLPHPLQRPRHHIPSIKTAPSATESEGSSVVWIICIVLVADAGAAIIVFVHKKSVN